MLPICRLLHISIAISVIYFCGGFIAATDVPNLTDGSLITRLATFTFSAIGMNFKCFVENQCNLPVTTDLLTLLRDNLQPLCDQDKPSEELISAVMHAGLALFDPITDLDSTCTFGRVFPPDLNAISLSPTNEFTIKNPCSINKCLRTILENFPDFRPIVDCLRPELHVQAGVIVVSELQKAVCKKYGNVACDFAEASTKIVGQLRALDNGSCGNASMKSVCESLGAL